MQGLTTENLSFSFLKLGAVTKRHFLPRCSECMFKSQVWSNHTSPTRTWIRSPCVQHACKSKTKLTVSLAPIVPIVPGVNPDRSHLEVKLFKAKKSSENYWLWVSVFLEFYRNPCVVGFCLVLWPRLWSGATDRSRSCHCTGRVSLYEACPSASTWTSTAAPQQLHRTARHAPALRISRPSIVNNSAVCTHSKLHTARDISWNNIGSALILR